MLISSSMSSTTFEVVRIFIIVSIMLLRIAVMPWYLQAYLNIAPKKLGRLKKESGRIKTDDMQKIVSFFYLNQKISHQYIQIL